MSSTSSSIGTPFTTTSYFCARNEGYHAPPLQILAYVRSSTLNNDGSVVLEGNWKDTSRPKSLGSRCRFELHPLNKPVQLTREIGIENIITGKKDTETIQMSYCGIVSVSDFSDRKLTVFMRTPKYLESAFSWINRDLYQYTSNGDSNSQEPYKIENKPSYSLQ